MRGMQGVLQKEHQEGDEVLVQEGGIVQGGQDVQEQMSALQVEQVPLHGNENRLSVSVVFFLMHAYIYFLI